MLDQGGPGTSSQASTTYARPDLLAGVDWLAAHVDDPSVRIVDCRYYFDGRSGRAAYEQGHITGAVHVHWPSDLADTDATPPNLIPQPEQLAATMGRIGVTNDTQVVGYDDEGGHFASRLWWVLTYYGHRRVRILNGGIQAWQAAGNALSTVQPKTRAAVFLPGPPHPAMRVRADELERELGSPELALIDVRRRSEYIGEEVRAARGGRIPGAQHLLWQDNLRDDKTFRTPDELRQRYLGAGITPDRRVVTYCQGGVRAAHSAFVLALIGYPNVRMYDGSWAEWGSSPHLSVETGEPPGYDVPRVPMPGGSHRT